jgi:hypothetical protein
MVIWNLLDGGSSRNGHLLESSDSLRGGTQILILITYMDLTEKIPELLKFQYK